MERLTAYIDGEPREDHSRDTARWKNGSRECMTRLAAYEDIGLTPDEIGALRADLARVTAERDVANARWEETASDNTGYTLTHLDGIYAVSTPSGHVVCEFLRDPYPTCPPHNYIGEEAVGEETT